jgi:hypothetical protein
VAILSGGGCYPHSYNDDLFALEFQPLPMAPHSIQRADSDIFSYFTSLLRTHRFADVKLVIEGEEVPAHRVILAARSRYFRSLLHGHFAEGAEDCAQVALHAVKLHSFKHVLEYLYTDAVNSAVFSSQEELLGVLECAGMLGVDGLLDDCENHLLNLLHEDARNDQIMPLLQVAETFGCSKLYWQCLKFLHYYIHLHQERLLLATTPDSPANSDRGSRVVAGLNLDVDVVQDSEAFGMLTPGTKQKVLQIYTGFLCVDILTVTNSLSQSIYSSDL